MSKTRRSFSAEQKADVARRYVKDKVAISDLAAEFSAEPLGMLAQQRLQGLTKITSRYALEVEPWNQLFDLVCSSLVSWKDARREVHSLTRIFTLVAHPTLIDLHGPSTSQYLSRRKAAILDYQASTSFIHAS